MLQNNIKQKDWVDEYIHPGIPAMLNNIYTYHTYINKNENIVFDLKNCHYLEKIYEYFEVCTKIDGGSIMSLIEYSNIYDIHKKNNYYIVVNFEIIKNIIPDVPKSIHTYFYDNNSTNTVTAYINTECLKNSYNNNDNMIFTNYTVDNIYNLNENKFINSLKKYIEKSIKNKLSQTFDTYSLDKLDTLDHKKYDLTKNKNIPINFNNIGTLPKINNTENIINFMTHCILTDNKDDLKVCLGYIKDDQFFDTNEEYAYSVSYINALLILKKFGIKMHKKSKKLETVEEWLERIKESPIYKSIRKNIKLKRYLKYMINIVDSNNYTSSTNQIPIRIVKDRKINKVQRNEDRKTDIYNHASTLQSGAAYSRINNNYSYVDPYINLINTVDKKQVGGGENTNLLYKSVLDIIKEIESYNIKLDINDKNKLYDSYNSIIESEHKYKNILIILQNLLKKQKELGYIKDLSDWFKINIKKQVDEQKKIIIKIQNNEENILNIYMNMAEKLLFSDKLLNQ